MSLGAYCYWHSLAFQPGSERSGSVLLFLMGISQLVALGQILAFLPVIIVLWVRAVKKKNYGNLVRWSPTLVVIAVFNFALPFKIARSDYFDMGVERLIANGEPVVSAIEGYRSEHGRYPESLEDVFGGRSIPKTGSRLYRPWEYSTDRDGTGGYELLVETTMGGANWDRLIYWPANDYPKRMYGGSVQRFSGWAYVHE